jgi:hypothetical protein
MQTQETLARYQRENGLPHGYRVDVPDQQSLGSGHHTADFTVFDRLHHPMGLDETLSLVEAYWMGPPGDYAEVVVAAPAESSRGSEGNCSLTSRPSTATTRKFGSPSPSAAGQPRHEPRQPIAPARIKSQPGGATAPESLSRRRELPR